jgi:glycosyltransferase involved in cell wall biosynthesis
MDRFMVIVVDDGSTDDTQAIASQQFPFAFRCLYQHNQGATTARNYGATISQADILVFIDDDVTISPQTLEALAETCLQNEKVLVMGSLSRRSSVVSSVYNAILLTSADNPLAEQDNSDLYFLACNTELLAIRRGDFLELGMLQDPTNGNGWPNWDDLDFGYRAYLKGFRLILSERAAGEHWDYSISDRATACQRWYRASRSAVWLFKKHNELQTLIPMLCDKTPLAWRQDSPRLIARKLARSLVSSQPVLGSTEKLVTLLERYYPAPVVLSRLYDWLHGAYMFVGYREGLREFELEGTEG